MGAMTSLLVPGSRAIYSCSVVQCGAVCCSLLQYTRATVAID